MAKRLLTDIVSEVNDYAKNTDSIVEDATVRKIVARAAFVLSKRDPALRIQKWTGDGSAIEIVLDATYWKKDFSRVINVFYPWIDTDLIVPPTPLDSQFYAVYEKTENSGIYYFRIHATTPSASEIVRIEHTTPHKITEDANSCTITNDQWEYDVILLAASIVCEQLAARAVTLGGSAISADTVDYQSRSAQYLALAKQYRAESGLAPYMTEAVNKVAAKFFDSGCNPNPADDLIRGY